MAKLPPVEKGIEIPPHLLDSRYAWGLQRLEVADSIFIKSTTVIKVKTQVARFRIASEQPLWNAIIADWEEEVEGKLEIGVRLWRIKDRPEGPLRRKRGRGKALQQKLATGAPLRAADVRSILNKQG